MKSIRNKKKITSRAKTEKSLCDSNHVPSCIMGGLNTFAHSPQPSIERTQKTRRCKTQFQLTCVDSSGRAALCRISEGPSSASRRRSGAHGGRSAVFERDIFFRFDSVGARIRKSSGPKEPTWAADLDTVCDPAHANNFTGGIYFMLRL
jgi:hypothetical protein